MYDDILETLPENVRMNVHFIYKAYEELHGYPAILYIHPSIPNYNLLNNFMEKYTFRNKKSYFPEYIVVNTDKREQPPEPGYGEMLARVSRDYTVVDVIRWCTDHPGKDYCQIIISTIPEGKRVQEAIIQPPPVSSFPLVAAMMVVAIL